MLAKEFGWTMQDIRDMSMKDYKGILSQINAYNKANSIINGRKTNKNRGNTGRQGFEFRPEDYKIGPK